MHHETVKKCRALSRVERTADFAALSSHSAQQATLLALAARKASLQKRIEEEMNKKHPDMVVVARCEEAIKNITGTLTAATQSKTR